MHLPPDVNDLPSSPSLSRALTSVSITSVRPTNDGHNIRAGRCREQTSYTQEDDASSHDLCDMTRSGDNSYQWSFS